MEKQELKRHLIEQLSDSSAALICNAYEFMGIHSPCTDWTVKCLTPQLPVMTGEAITISLDCSTPDVDREVSLYYKMIEMIERSDLPRVVVIKSLGNYSYGAVAGDGMAKTMLAAGAAGLITNGPVRDLNDIKRAGFKTFAGGVTANHHSLRWSALGQPVMIGGLNIHTGDIIHGDNDGIVNLPEKGWNRIVRACGHVADFERKAHVIFRRTDILIVEKERRIKELAEEYRSYI